jgi:iron complex transport system substrate-binding protein
MRICSLLPSATEIVFSLGLGDHLVAVTHECDYPAEARRLPIVTRTAIAEGGSSKDIDHHVNQAAHTGSSIYALDQALIERLDPDLILTQELCEVCAVSSDTARAAVQRLPGERTILSLGPSTIEGILQTIEHVGAAAGVPERASAVVEAMKERIGRVAATAATAPIRPRVFAMEWLDPPYTAGHWVPEMVRLAGGLDALGREGAFSYETTWPVIAKWDPEVLVLMPCSFHLDRTLEELSRLDLPDEWRRLTAVQSGRVYAVDSAAYFSRSGPRAAAGLEILGEIIHPELFRRTSPPDAWQSVR